MCSERPREVHACPYCGGLRLRRWGHLAGRLRYRCQACARTFTSQTGRPEAYLKRLRKWRRMPVCLARRWSIRLTAAQLGIHPSTAFRWRHRWLDFLRNRPRPPLQGIVEVVDTYLSESAKGQRCLARPPRRHAVPHLRFDEAERVWVVLACDRQGNRFAAKLDWPPVPADSLRDIPRVAMLEPVLLPRLSPGSTLHTERRTWYADLCRRHGIPHRAVRDLAKPHFTADERRRWAETPEGRLGYHINAAGALRRRLKPWLIPFRGVATRYLDNYLAWFIDAMVAGGNAQSRAGATPTGSPRHACAG